MSPDGTVRVLGDEAGFFTLASYRYAGKHPEVQGDMKETRLFYAFQPADDRARDKPVFVFFNGGPGCATTSVLFAFNTAKRSIDTPEGTDPPWVDNPHSFTRLGNVLYVDSRDAGFSYNLKGSPNQDPVARHAGADAADVLRLVLRFLDRHEPLRDNPVVLVGESWGGSRANVMASLVRSPDALRDPESEYVDPTLADEIDAHFALAFPGDVGKIPAEELALRQFGWQVLIQPVVLGPLQWEAHENLPSSDALNREHEQARFDSAATRIQDYHVLKALIGVDPAAIRDMLPRHRGDSNRERCDVADLGEDSLHAVLGELPRWDDCYHTSCTTNALEAYDAYAVPMAFVSNLGRVETLITNAVLDDVVRSPAIVDALRTQPQMFRNVEVSSAPNVPRSAVILLDVQEETSLLLGIPSSVAIRFPAYEAGHSVPMYTPGEFLADVGAWLGDSAAYPD
jgi:pimeloyl-ACP methyl ester carboxylesterase